MTARESRGNTNAFGGGHDLSGIAMSLRAAAHQAAVAAYAQQQAAAAAAAADVAMLNKIYSSLAGPSFDGPSNSSGSGDFSNEANAAKYNAAGMDVEYGSVGNVSSGELVGISWWHGVAPRSSPAIQVSPVGDAAVPNITPASSAENLWTGKVEYQQVGLIVGGGVFSGEVEGPSGNRGLVEGVIVSGGLQLGYFDGTVNATFNGTREAPDSGPNGGFFNVSVDAGFGPANVMGVSWTAAAYVGGDDTADLGRSDFTFEQPGFDTDVDIWDPSSYLDMKKGVGGSAAFNGFIVTDFNLID